MTDDLTPNLAAGLRTLADMIDRYPETAPAFEYTLRSSGIYLFPDQNERLNSISGFTRVAIASGVDKVSIAQSGENTGRVNFRWPTGVLTSFLVNLDGITLVDLESAVSMGSTLAEKDQIPWWSTRHPMNPWTPHGYHVSPYEEYMATDSAHAPVSVPICKGVGHCPECTGYFSKYHSAVAERIRETKS